MPGTLTVIGLLLFLCASVVQARDLTAVSDSYGVPFARALQVEVFGVLDNDRLDGEPAGENGATAELVSGVTSGILNCPTDLMLSLCSDGSFDYVPGPNFNGTDSFTYRVVTDSETSAAVTVTLTACTGGPRVFSCWQESSYMTKLEELGYSHIQEGFEGAVWDIARIPSVATSIVSAEIIWASNQSDTNDITTATGPARTGNWGLFDPNHGIASGTVTECDIDNPPTHCLYHDGFSGKSVSGNSILYGVGAYITGTAGAKISVIHGANQVIFGALPNSDFYFFGVIEASTTGFNRFEFRELDGKVGQRQLIFGDDFIIAALNGLPGNVPPVADAGRPHMVQLGGMVSLDGSGSTDVDGDVLTYNWSLTSVPVDSTANLSDSTSTTASFVADKLGAYRVQLVVNDGFVDSTPDTVSICTDSPVMDCTDINLLVSNLEFSVGMTCCIGQSSLTLGPNVTVREGAELLLSAPVIHHMNNVNIEPGASMRVFTK